MPAVYDNLNLNRQLTAGDPINSDSLKQAELVAKILRCSNESGDPAVSDHAATSAALRVKTIESAYSADMYGSELDHEFQMLRQLIEDRFDEARDHFNEARYGFENRLYNIFDISNVNMRIINRNVHRPPREAEPLLKTKPGDGFELAEALARGLEPNVLQNFPAPAAVGATPEFFHQNTISNYGHREVLEMVHFYNNDFGILPTDPLGTRREKFHDFLAGR
ncbi:hypothetical protein BD779DRAFT_1676951 [Infundibulicybe gibba]|nr:hypothetical protein BD779DRAFT_1676951 [Infundibulicybe gibba]